MKNYSKVLIIYNPNANKGKIDEIIPKIKKRLLVRYSQVDTMTSQNEDGAEELAFKNAGKYDIIVSCGGDGTLHNIINGVAKSKEHPLIGVLPYGTCNDIARTLHIPFDLDKAVDCILRLNTTEYDLMNDGKECIVYSYATGYLTGASYLASAKTKKRVGRFAYFLAALKCMFKFKSLPITVTCDGERIHGKFVYMMLLNGETAGGFRLNKGEDLSNGKVKLVMIKKSKFLGSFFEFLKLFLRGVKSLAKSKNSIVRDVQNIEIENHANAPFTMDGEKDKFLKKNIVIDRTITMIKK